jgi:hypothetical protein
MDAGIEEGIFEGVGEEKMNKPIIIVDCANAPNGCNSQIEFELQPLMSFISAWSANGLNDFLLANAWSETDQGEWRCPDCKGETR